MFWGEFALRFAHDDDSGGGGGGSGGRVVWCGGRVVGGYVAGV